MLPFSDLLIFVAALSAAYLLPGPDMAMVMNVAVRRGARNGLLAAIGLAASRGTHVISSGLGLSAVFAAYPVLFGVVRWLGAIYLLWLAWKIMTAGQATEETAVAADRPGHAAIWLGFFTNLLNPKAFMFCALFLPQFIAPARSPLLGQYAALGLILVGTGFLFDVIYVLAARTVARRLGSRRTGGRLPRMLFAGVFALTAVRLVVP